MKACTFFFLLLLPFFLPGQSDECARFDDMIKKAEQALRAEDYQTTLIRLNEAKNLYCYEKNMQADEWIEKLFKTMETKTRNEKQEMEKAADDPARFQTHFAAYLASEAEMAFFREDIRLAWRLTLAALEKDPDNVKAQHLKQELPGYGTDFFLEVLDEFWRAEISPDSAYFSFFTNVEDWTGTLNVLELGGDKTPQIFSNSDKSLHRYSPDSRYLIFFTNVEDDDEGIGTLNVLDLGENESLLTFPNSASARSEYSPDSRYLVFYTREADRSRTLNVLELGGNKAPQTFPNCDRGNYPFSPNSQYLQFFTNVVEDHGTLNVLDLGGNKSPLMFPNSYMDSDRYSPDGRRLIFFTNVVGDHGTLNILEMGGNKAPLTFPNTGRWYWNFSPDGRRLIFFTNVVGNHGTLNMLELPGNTPPLTFPNTDRGYWNYSPDGRHLAFLAGDQATVNIIDLDSKKVAQQIKKQYPDPPGEGRMTFLNKNNLLVSSINPVTENEIFKIINLERIGEGYWDYLTKERYAPLTAEEKRAYGIVE